MSLHQGSNAYHKSRKERISYYQDQRYDTACALGKEKNFQKKRKDRMSKILTLKIRKGYVFEKGEHRNAKVVNIRNEDVMLILDNGCTVDPLTLQ